MTRVMALVGLALAASAGAAPAADLGKGRDRPARELRFDRVEPEHPRRAPGAFREAHDRRRGPPYPSIWRGYPQSR